MTKSKYIVIRPTDEPAMAVIFDEMIFHKLLALSLLGRFGAPLSAGFVGFDKEGLPFAYGESTSLRMKSRPEDTKLVRRALGFEC